MIFTQSYMEEIQMKRNVDKRCADRYIDDAPMYLFNNGTNYESYRMLGAHKMTDSNGEDGYFFAVWAPNARSVAVVCDGNGWERDKGLMYKHQTSGIWELFLPGITEGQNYKFSIVTPKGDIILKIQDNLYYLKSF